jgi:FkbM family methyltransferase
MKYTVSYAQNFEDLTLEAFFPDVEKGHYVDVGAFHPVIDSVTKRFYLRGWRGINIEPQKALFDALVLDRTEDINLNLGIAGEPGSLTFNEYLVPGLSTFSKELAEAYASRGHQDTGKPKHYDAPVDTLRGVLAANPLPHIHFMKIDVEGLEYDVLKSNDWGRFLPDVLCIEANHITKDWHGVVAGLGYELVHSDAVNEYFVSHRARPHAKHFQENYVRLVVEGDPIKARHYEKLTGAERKVRSLKAQVEVEAQEIEQLKLQLNHFRTVIWKPLGIRKLLIELARSINASILWRLELWEYNAQEKRSSSLAGGEVPKASGGEALLAAVQATDRESYWDATSPPLAPRMLRRAYKLLWRFLGLFVELYRLVKWAVRGVRRRWA